MEPISQTSGVDVLVQGLCAFLFGICYHFNREPGEITRKTLHPIITRLGADHLTARMSRVRDDDRFRHVTPESAILPLHPSLVATTGVPEAEIWLDWGFIEFWKANYCKLVASLNEEALSFLRHCTTGTLCWSRHHYNRTRYVPHPVYVC